MIKIKIKKIGKDSKIPIKQKEGDAGFDAYICRFKGVSNEREKELFDCNEDEVYLSSLQRVLCMLGFFTEIPKGYYGQVLPRSGLALWNGLTILNSPGTIDADYRGDVGVILINHGTSNFIIKKGERIGQLVFAKFEQAEFELTEELSDTDRGDGGFGSTGK